MAAMLCAHRRRLCFIDHGVVIHDSGPPPGPQRLSAASSSPLATPEDRVAGDVKGTHAHVIEETVIFL